MSETLTRPTREHRPEALVDLPSDNKALVREATKIIEQCRNTAGARAAYYRQHNAMMETGMNSGPKLAPGELQRTLGMKPDGVLGSRTTAAVNAMEPTTAIGAVLGAWRDKHRALQATGLVKYDQAHTAGWPDRRRQFADTMPANTAPEATSIPPVTSR